MSKYHILSLGAGVQSSCLALMAEHNLVTPKPSFAVFADTQAEPQAVYDYIEYLEKQLSYPIYKVTAGNLEDEAITIKKATDQSKMYKEGEEYSIIQIPVFGKMPNGKITAAIGRKCTRDYKIRPIQRFIKKQLNINTYLRKNKGVVTTWIGISTDEVARMKPSHLQWIIHKHPLIDMGMSRQDCIQWLKENNYKEPVRSACYFCPFHGRDDWDYLKTNHPKEFEKAVQFDRELRETSKKYKGRKMEVYLHKSCKPLNEVDFSENKGQDTFDFLNECEGMCGI